MGSRQDTDKVMNTSVLRHMLLTGNWKHSGISFYYERWFIIDTVLEEFAQDFGIKIEYGDRSSRLGYAQIKVEGLRHVYCIHFRWFGKSVEKLRKKISDELQGRQTKEPTASAAGEYQNDV